VAVLRLLELHLQAGRLLVLAGGRRLKLDGSHIEVVSVVIWSVLQTGSNGTAECVLRWEKRRKYSYAERRRGVK
jgi:hypothetical protein